MFVYNSLKNSLPSNIDILDFSAIFYLVECNTHVKLIINCLKIFCSVEQVTCRCNQYSHLTS
jgi:hypothetical protein